ncbi:MAG: WG repeat-containing protein [Clostridia bacterium]|nr:WG repeat-containing protein [Clostridia bacterium]
MKKRILHFIGTQIVRLVSLGILLALTAASMMYLHGYFDLSFVDRVSLLPESAETESIDTEAVTEPPAVDTEAVTEPVETDTAEVPSTNQGSTAEQKPQNQTQTSTPAVQKESAKSVIEGLKTAKTLQSQGYSAQTTGIYKRGTTVLAKLTLSGLGKNFSYSEYEVRDTQVTEYEKGCIVTEEIFVTEERPAVTLRNGYIIRDVNGKFTLLKPDGTTLLSDYDESDFRLTELRDENGNALFASVKRVKKEVYLPIIEKEEYSLRPLFRGQYEEEPVEMVVEELTYYILSPEGKWVVSTYTDEYPPKETDLGLQFDSPMDFGESEGTLERYYANGRWGYKNAKTGEVVIYPRYTEAYNFKDGYAIALDGYKIYFLNERGEAVYQIGYAEPEQFQTYENITLPDTNGIESLGFYYFSHGLTRIRVRQNLVTYKYYYYIKESDDTYLYDVQGNRFPLPAGYTLKGYSDGVILLQNNETGLYGCMNYKIEWVVQPQYSYVTPSLSGMIVVGNETGKKGLVDTAGNWILPQVFDYISDPSAGMVAVYDKTVGWQVFRMMRK